MSLGGSKFIEYAIYSPGLLSTFEAIAVRERTKALGGLKEVFLKSQVSTGFQAYSGINDTFQKTSLRRTQWGLSLLMRKKT